ncbi:MAG: hypothetical protein VYD86_05865 [Verrucomicrobiota bacterium]|nr:hypothetical protein [Verrucomicrobiota bacterium]
MRTGLRWVSLVVLVLGLMGWAATGFHWGWSKTSVTEMQLDEITGLEFPVTTNRLVFGVEILVVSLLLAGVSFGASFAFEKNNSRETN